MDTTYFKSDIGYAIWCQRGSCGRCRFKGCECPCHKGGIADPAIVATVKENSVARGWMGAQCQLGKHERCKKSGCACKHHSQGAGAATVIIKEEALIASEEHVKELQERIYASEASFINFSEDTKNTLSETLDLVGSHHDGIDAKVKEFDQRLATMEKAKKLEVKLPGKAKAIEVGIVHRDFEKVLRWVRRKRNTVYLVGGAGGGKTEMARQICEALGFDPKTQYHPQSFGPQTTQAQLIGSVSPTTGECIHSPAFHVFRDGGLYLGDELDAGHPGVLTIMNSVFANEWVAFGCKCGVIRRHKDAYFITAANTYGKGADHIYVGRNQLDGATLNRFKWINLDYDWDLTRLLTGHDEAANYVEKLSECAAELKLRVIIGPRQAMAMGEALLDEEDRTEAEEVIIWGPINVDDRRKIMAAYDRKYPAPVVEQEPTPEFHCKFGACTFVATNEDDMEYHVESYHSAEEIEKVTLEKVLVGQGVMSQEIKACPKCKAAVKDDRAFNVERRKQNRYPIPDFRCTSCKWKQWSPDYDWKLKKWKVMA